MLTADRTSLALSDVMVASSLSVAPQAEPIHYYCALHKKILVASKSQKYYWLQIINAILTSEFMSLLLQGKKADSAGL
jgi:hypothetical protein